MIKKVFDNKDNIRDEIQRMRNNGEPVEKILELIAKIDIDKHPEHSEEVINYLHGIIEAILKEILNNKYILRQNIKRYHKKYPKSIINIKIINDVITLRNNSSHNVLTYNKNIRTDIIRTYFLYIKIITQEGNIDLKTFILPDIGSHLKELIEEYESKDNLEEENEEKSQNSKIIKYGSIFIISIISIIYSLTSDNSDNKIIFLSGTKDGTYYTMAKQLKEYDDNIEVSTSKGSIDNLKNLGEKKRIGFGLVQEDVLKEFAKEAIKGKESQKRILKNISLLNTILNEEIYILVREDSNMSSFQDIKEKKISIGSEKSGNAITAQSIYKKLFHQTLENRYYYKTFSKSLYALNHNSIEAIIIVGGEPLLKLQKTLKGIKLLSYHKEKALKGYTIGKIEQKSYPWITSDIRTLMVRSFLVTNLSQNKDLEILSILERFKKSIENNQTTNIHPKWREFTAIDCLPTLTNGLIYHSAVRLNHYCPNVNQLLKIEKK